MKLVPDDNVVIRCSIQEYVMQFVESDSKSSRVENYPHKNGKSCAHSFAQTIKNLKLTETIGVTRRGNVVRLYKKIYFE